MSLLQHLPPTRIAANPHSQTAYGSLHKIPKNTDLLIAGFSCVDFSNLNNKRKKLNENGESGGTFLGILNYAKRYRPRIVILENVKSCPWDQVAKYWRDIGYITCHVTVDTKEFYLPQTRLRGYMFCLDSQSLSRSLPVGDAMDVDIDDEVDHNNEVAATVGAEILQSWESTFTTFKRQASSPAGEFMLDLDGRRLEAINTDLIVRFASSNPRAVVDWSRYQIRHQDYRDENFLGDRRPLTRSAGELSCKMPDFFWHVWAKAQPERIWDTLDMNFLRKLDDGYDMNYKEYSSLPFSVALHTNGIRRYLDLSQGIDREIDSRPPGIMGCITPCGIPFITTRGGPLTGREALALQGLPIDRLLLTRESHRELEDLAGNAMSSTVVGAAILSALISGYKILEKGGLGPVNRPESSRQKIVPTDKYLMVENDDRLDQALEITVADLQADAAKSARCCVCEGQSQTKPTILACTLCGHTACSDCAGNPTHKYTQADLERSSPLGFTAFLQNVLPPRLIFSGVSPADYQPLKADSRLRCDAKTWESFFEAVTRALHDELRFSIIKRAEVWTIVYEGKNTVLHLVIESTVVTWLLFAKPLPSEPISALIRDILSKPVARMVPSGQSLLEGTWEICAPLSSRREMIIHGAGDNVPSYEQVCGLETDEHEPSVVWTQLVINGSDDDVQHLDADIRGTYTRLPECGMANATLHKKDSAPDVQAVYLFLDPTKLGDATGDMFVFSRENRRVPGYASRLTLAEVSHKWRSSKTSEHPKSVGVYHRRWINVPGAVLQPYAPEAPTSCRSLSTDASISIDGEECHHANVTILAFGALPKPTDPIRPEDTWDIIDPNHASTAQDLSWIVQHVSGFNDFESWNTVTNITPLTADTEAKARSACATCAPSKPRTLWTRNKSGIKGYEHPHDAALYERLTKSKPSAFVIFRRAVGPPDLRVTLNIQTLLHQAYDKLVGARTDPTASFTWRLVPNAYHDTKPVLPAFTLRGNAGDTEGKPRPERFKVDLRPEQRRSLSWMIAQEGENVPAFQEEETEEAFLPLTTWRAEGKVTVQKNVRGGILADDVGYGKTAIIIALIATTYGDKMKPPLDTNHRLMPIRTTLIIAPHVMVGQWETEIKKFMHIKDSELLVLTRVGQLSKKSVQNMSKRRIVLVSSRLFNSQTYYANIQRFTGMPDVPPKPGRNFDHWFEDANEALKEHMWLLRDRGCEHLLRALQTKRKEVEEADTRFTYAPSKRLRGRMYAEANHGQQMDIDESQVDISSDESDDDMDPVNLLARVDKCLQIQSQLAQGDPVDSSEDEDSSNKSTTNGKPAPDEASQEANDRKAFNVHDSLADGFLHVQLAFLHAYSFDRIVIDEFTYSDPDRLVPLQALEARSKWILSGTPPLNDFADVNTIAPFFGLHLGVDDDEVAPKRGARQRLGVEAFQAFKEPYSSAWHQNRHDIAQRFLNRFARKNVPEIGELPSTEHIVLVEQTPAENVLYLELHRQLMAQKDQFRRVRKGKFVSNRVEQVNEIIGVSRTPMEALIKRGSALAFKSRWNGGTPDPVTLESLMALRQEQIKRIKAELQTKFKLASWLFLHQDLEHLNYLSFVESVCTGRFGDVPIAREVYEIFKASIAQSQNDDWRQFFVDEENPADNDERVGRVLSVVSTPRLQTMEAELDVSDHDDPLYMNLSGQGHSSEDTSDSVPKSDDKPEQTNPAAPDQPSAAAEINLPKKPVTKAEFTAAMREVVKSMEGIMPEFVRQNGTISFLKTVQAIQRPSYVPECNACRVQLTSLAGIYVLASCGHVLCAGCTSGAADIEECTRFGCGGSGKGFEALNGSLLARGPEPDVECAPGAPALADAANPEAAAAEANTQSNNITPEMQDICGSKLAKLVSLIAATPANDKVLLFIQFPDIMDLASKALTLAGIKHQMITASNNKGSRQVEQIRNDTNGFKVIILNLGSEMAAGLYVLCPERTG